MKIHQVKTVRELKTFIDLPYRLYKGDDVWVPPLRSEIAGQFNHVKNPFLDHCTYALFLLKHNDEIVGRIAAFVDHLAIEAWQETIGLFGYYECLPEKEYSDELLGAAQKWLIGQGMTSMRGPWSFVTQEWGSVLEGFKPSPVVMSPYNPPFYNEHYQEFGLRKAKDLLVYLIDAQKGYRIPTRILSLTEKVAERYKVSTRLLDMKNLDEEVENIITLSNQSLVENWGYSPVTDDEVRAMVRDLKQIVHPRAIIFAEDSNGTPIGFAIAIPDINEIIKGLNGRLLPFGWIKLLIRLPKLNHYRMFALGVIPQYHGKGIDSMLYRALYESIFSPELRLEINYVLEDNAPMNNAIIKLGAEPFRRYRVYEMKFD